MKRLLTLLALTAALVLPVAAAPKKPAKPAAEKPAEEKVAPDFTGHYERTGDAKTVFILIVRHTGASAEMEFSTSRADGTGAAPDGNGKGSLNDKGELEFAFDDSFGNKGTAVLKKTGASFQITIKPETVADPRAVKLYGVIALKKTPDREN
jgi:hypothetical protein